MCEAGILTQWLGLTDTREQWMAWLPKGRTRVELVLVTPDSCLLYGIQIDDLDIGRFLVLTVGHSLYTQHLLGSYFLMGLPAHFYSPTDSCILLPFLLVMLPWCSSIVQFVFITERIVDVAKLAPSVKYLPGKYEDPSLLLRTYRNKPDFPGIGGKDRRSPGADWLANPPELVPGQ